MLFFQDHIDRSVPLKAAFPSTNLKILSLGNAKKNIIDLSYESSISSKPVSIKTSVGEKVKSGNNATLDYAQREMSKRKKFISALSNAFPDNELQKHIFGNPPIPSEIFNLTAISNKNKVFDLLADQYILNKNCPFKQNPFTYDNETQDYLLTGNLLENIPKINLLETLQAVSNCPGNFFIASNKRMMLSSYNNFTQNVQIAPQSNTIIVIEKNIFDSIPINYTPKLSDETIRDKIWVVQNPFLVNYPERNFSHILLKDSEAIIVRMSSKNLKEIIVQIYIESKKEYDSVKIPLTTFIFSETESPSASKKAKVDSPPSCIY